MSGHLQMAVLSTVASVRPVRLSTPLVWREVNNTASPLQYGLAALGGLINRGGLLDVEGVVSEEQLASQLEYLRRSILAREAETGSNLIAKTEGGLDLTNGPRHGAVRTNFNQGVDLRELCIFQESVKRLIEEHRLFQITTKVRLVNHLVLVQDRVSDG